MKRVYFLILLILNGCGPEYDTKYYKAISPDKGQTALLKLEISKDFFHGDYQVIYDDKSKDDGKITGNVKGDTLTGNFRYLSRENARSIVPIVFLKTGKNLRLGTGEAGTYMGFKVYSRGSVSFNDSLFLFQPIEIQELNSLKNLTK